MGKTLHNLGNAFLHMLDDVRQKVVEEAWSGQVQTPSHQLNTEFSDFRDWLYGPPGDQQKEAGGQDGLKRDDDGLSWVYGQGEASAEAKSERDIPDLTDDDGLELG